MSARRTRQVETDVLIIGGGISAAMVAEKLTANTDDNVLIVEAGQHSTPTDQRARARQRYIDYGENPWHNDHIDDQHPMGIMSRSMAVGGQALHWGGTVPRYSPEDFQLQSTFGVHEDWPIT
jgi:quinoprotein glucose dehydrogenase